METVGQRISKLNKIVSEICGALGISEKDLRIKDAGTQKKFKLDKDKLIELKVAAIMDDFSRECFSPECRLINITPDGWKKEVEGFKPDILIIESAWQGKDGLWNGKINHCALELRELIDFCHNNEIPVVFWNKEDPVYTSTFMEVARRADYVFTTEIECVEKYKAELGHERVYHLHFAAQPELHNPIEKFDRKNKFCFAGSYYPRYTDRCKVFDDFSKIFDKISGFDIYDRNYQKKNEKLNIFPEEYKKYILGNLKPSEIDTAYKGYLYGVNMNSIAQGQTMFARRVFELMASNTIVVSNYSRGLKNYFGDLVFCTNNKETLESQLNKCAVDRIFTDKLRLAALRAVLSGHLYEDRLDYIVEKVFGRSIKKQLPFIRVVSNISNENEAVYVAECFKRQSYSNSELCLYIGDHNLKISKGERINIVSQDKNVVEENMDSAMFVTYFDPADHYGKNYLKDMALTCRYIEAEIIGKNSYFGKEMKLFNSGSSYKMSNDIPIRRAMVQAHLCQGLLYSELSGDYIFQSKSVFSIDPYNYCYTNKNNIEDTEDLFIPDQGIPINVIEETAEEVSISLLKPESLTIGVREIARLNIGKDGNIKCVNKGEFVHLVSSLDEEKHQYYYDRSNYSIDSNDGSVSVIFQGDTEANIMGCIIFLNVDNERLGAETYKLNRSTTTVVPKGTKYIRYGYRVKGSGEARLYRITVGDENTSNLHGGCFLSRSDKLVLTNHYPSPEELYRNAFVHRRLLAYKESGLVTEVFRMNPWTKNLFREYEGINVTEGQEDVLELILTQGNINTVCVHFLDNAMWEVLKNHLYDTRLIIWLHGAEVQPWWRRKFNFDVNELESEKLRSNARMSLWKEVFKYSEENDIHFVFVSNYFANEVMEDYEIKLPEDKYSVIHNFIDTELFRYEEKDPELRKHILTIKSFASKTYANDITAKAILELSKKEYFRDINFYIYGRGERFKKDTQSIEHFQNVHLNNVYLSQKQIADLHKKCGVYIGTSRADTQGVSRDEAMSSGLVPICNAVAAIPEFVDDTCGYLVPAEDFKGVAAAIEELYKNPEKFEELSKRASERVQNTLSKLNTINKELDILVK